MQEVKNNATKVEANERQRDDLMCCVDIYLIVPLTLPGIWWVKYLIAIFIDNYLKLMVIITLKFKISSYSNKQSAQCTKIQLFRLNVEQSIGSS